MLRRKLCHQLRTIQLLKILTRISRGGLVNKLIWIVPIKPSLNRLLCSLHKQKIHTMGLLELKKSEIGIKNRQDCRLWSLLNVKIRVWKKKKMKMKGSYLKISRKIASAVKNKMKYWNWFPTSLPRNSTKNTWAAWTCSSTKADQVGCQTLMLKKSIAVHKGGPVWFSNNPLQNKKRPNQQVKWQKQGLIK